MTITSAWRGRNCDRTRSEAGASRRCCDHPSAARVLPGPGTGGLHKPARRLSAPGERCRRRGQSPRPGAPVALPRLGARIGPGEQPPPPPRTGGAPGFRFPALALPQPQKPTHRHHNKGGDAAATPGWEDWGTTVGLAVRPLAEQRARPPVPVGAAREQAAGWKRWGCLEVLLTLVRQLVELRHLERAAPLFQRLPAAVHCGAETVFAREVRMRSSLPAAPRRTAPAAAGGGRPGSARASPGRGAPSGAAPRPSAPSTAAGRRQEGRSERPVSRRPCPGPAPERGGKTRELPSPAGPAPGPRRPPPPGLAPGARSASRAAAAGTAGCLFPVGKGREGGREARAG